MTPFQAIPIAGTAIRVCMRPSVPTQQQLDQIQHVRHAVAVHILRAGGDDLTTPHIMLTHRDVQTFEAKGWAGLAHLLKRGESL